jgi:TnpA family transposase
VAPEPRLSPLHVLKPPPGLPTPQAVRCLTAQLDCSQATGRPALDLTWRNNHLQKALARHAAQARAGRLRLREAPQRYTVLVGFLRQTSHEPLDPLVEMDDQLVTATYRRAHRTLDEAVKRHRRMLRTTLQSFHTIGQTLFNEPVLPEAVRTTVLQQIPPARLQRQLQEAQQGLSGDTRAVFPCVMKRSSSLRQFAPTLREHLPVDLEPTGAPARLDALGLLRDLHTSGRRARPEERPVACLPQRLPACVGTNGTRQRRAYACAVLTTLRDESKRGNVWIRGSTRFGKLDDFFLPDATWTARRQGFFRNAGLPADPAEAATGLTTRLNAADDRFLAALPTPTSVPCDKERWHRGPDPSEALTPADEAGVATLRTWRPTKAPTLRLPELRLAVDNDLNGTRHFLPRGRRDTRTADEVGPVVATSMASGCKLGPETMAPRTTGGSDADMQRLTDGYLHDEALRAALADIVHAMLALDPTQVWGDGSPASRDGQRVLCPQRVLRRTSRHRWGDFALEFYPCIAANSAPFYAVPSECTARAAPSVLDGLLSHESDLDPEEPSTDTHGDVALNLAAFPRFGKRFCPRIRGLHHQWIDRIDPQKTSGPRTALVSQKKRTMHLDWSTAHWDRMGQCFASLAAGQTTASVALNRVLACGPRNHFDRAVRELGRVFKTLFILDYLPDPALRRRVRRGLRKGEQLHALARHGHYGKRPANSHTRACKQGQVSAHILRQHGAPPTHIHGE